MSRTDYCTRRRNRVDALHSLNHARVREFFHYHLCVYAPDTHVPLPKNPTQSFDAQGRPKAHGEFEKMRSYVLGHIPPEEDRWRRFNDFYINLTRSIDAHVDSMLRELDDLHLADRTIFVYTSDHGEMAGSHGLHGKGPFAYEETMHLPFFVVHPDVKGGQDIRALSAHIDVVATLLSMAGVDATKRAQFAGRTLPGKDLGSVLTSPGAADAYGARDAVRFTYSGLVTNDSGLFKVLAYAKAAGKTRRWTSRRRATRRT